MIIKLIIERFTLKSNFNVEISYFHYLNRKMCILRKNDYENWVHFSIFNPAKYEKS